MENIVLILGILFMFVMGFVMIELMFPTGKKKKARKDCRKKSNRAAIKKDTG